ncbi:MAG TPA: hypothetical protein VLW85_15415 [Myxococcales bacterium]|nr:hypothetical protein [Myxococcales bacterium]
MLLIPALLAVACDDDKAATSDELTIVVQGDRRELEQQEKSLKEREESLQKDKSQLDQRIADLARGLKAAADAEQKRRIEEELQRNQDQEAQLSSRATALRAQKSEVEAKKQAIDSDMYRAAQAALDARAAQLATREAKLADREGQLQQQLKDLGARDQKLAEREKDVALREKAVVAFERQTPAFNARDLPKASAVESKHKKLLAEIEARGILISDLPPEEQPLNAEIYAARRQRDFARAWDLLGDFTKAVAKLKVDQRFVEQKIGRLQGARAQARLSDLQRSEVEKILRDVTSDFSDGKYEQANKGLNRIAVILDANAASG